MNQPSPEWIAEQQAAERAQVVRFDGLTHLALRLDGYIARAEETADVLACMPNGNPADRRQEAEDLRRCVELVAFFQGNLDRVHLIEEPARRQGSGFARRRTAR